MSKQEAVHGTVVGSGDSPALNLNGQTCGTSKFLTPSDAPRLVAEAELHPFAACCLRK